MKSEQRGIIFYPSYYKAVKDLDDDTRNSIINAILDYGFTGEHKKLGIVANAVFSVIKPSIDNNIKNYENGKKGGRPKTDGFEKTKTDGFENCKTTKDKDKEKEKDKERDKDKDNTLASVSAHEKIEALIKDWQSPVHRIWQENIAYNRNIDNATLMQAIDEAIRYIVNEGKALNDYNIKHYTNVQIGIIKARPQGTIEERKNRFLEECRKIKDKRNSEFFAYYSQPSQNHEGHMLFEDYSGWDTQTRFIEYTKKHPQS